MRELCGVLLAFSLVGCNQSGFDTGKTPPKVEDAIRDYYVKKYPTFGRLLAIRRQNKPPLEAISQTTDLEEKCAVDEISNSRPDGPFLTFVERTELPEDKVLVTRVDLYAVRAGGCRVRLRATKQEKQKHVGYSTLAPISERTIRDLLHATD